MLRSNLAMSCYSMFTSASIPFPFLVFIKAMPFLEGTRLVVTHIGFPHPKSASYVGNPHQLLKNKACWFSRKQWNRKTSPCPSLQFSSYTCYKTRITLVSYSSPSHVALFHCPPRKC